MANLCPERTSLIETVRSNCLIARKERRSDEASILRTLIGEIETVEKRTGVSVTDQQVLDAIKKLIKSNNETIKLMPDSDLRNGLIRENDILNVYLPAQLSEETIRRIIAEQNLQGIPAVMQYLNSNYSGQFDKALASSIARSA